jgi:NAD(P)H-dependent flavin oxidoreductase YrpB (nitropropane dioxygenase family)
MAALHTPLCDLLDIEIPILQAGMGRTRGSTTTVAMVVAVSEAGGLGCLGCSGLTPAQIRESIDEIRRQTDKPFAVNVLLPVSLADADVPRRAVREEIRQNYPEHWRFVRALCERFGLDPDITCEKEWAISPTLVREQVEVIIEERVPVFAAGLGDPAWVVPLAHEVGAKVIGLSGSPRHAERQVAAGVDIVVAQGFEAGGHTGLIATLPLVPQIVDRVAPTPVVAAGGIADGRAVAAALALGAQGVWCGSAFLFAEESSLFDDQRRQLVEAESRDVVPGRTYTGKTSRGVQNDVTRAWLESDLDPLPMPYQGVLMDDFQTAAEAAGRHDLIWNAAGQIVGLLDRVEPASVIAKRLATQAAEVIDALPRYTARDKAPVA